MRRSPDALALSDGAQTWTYGALGAWASRLAARLGATGVNPGDRVAVCLPRSPELVVAFLAALEAGATYVPLDPSYPDARLRFMLADVEAAALVSEPTLAGRLEDAPPLVCVEDATGPALEPRRDPDPHGLAAIIYTSGSTGRPKGVGLTHAALVGLADNPELFTVHEGEGVAQCANASFDAWLQEVIAALLGGARLEIIDTDTLLSAPDLARAIEGRGVRTMFLPTGLFNQLAAVGPATFRGVHTLAVGGDVPDPRGVRSVLESCNGTCVKNGYGPTECTVFTTYFAMSRPDEVPNPIPIGRPLAGVEVWLLDEDGRKVPDGQIGEVYIGGPGVAPGYWRAPELTAQRFVPHPERPDARLYRTGDLARIDAQGILHFGGRRDLQVKVRGYRVELEEIEAVLGAYPGVRERVVVAPRDTSGQRSLVAYFVPSASPGPTIAELTAHLEANLPAFMRPAVIVSLDSLPLTANGKVDRDRLPDPFADRTPSEAPRTKQERAVAALYEAVLGRRDVGTGDDFFDLGGHSLLVTRLLWQIEQALGVVLSARDIYETRSVGRLAERLAETAPNRPSAPPVTRISRDGELPLTFAQARVGFLAQLRPDDVSYNSAAVVRLRGPIDPAALQASLRDLVARHEALRTTVVRGSAGPAARIHPPFDPHLERIDLPGLDDAAREAAAAERTRAEARRPFQLDRLPLIRWSLARFDPEDHALMIVEHHVVHDGWSFNLLLTELCALYRARQDGLPSSLEPLGLQIVDVAAWQRAFMATPAGQAQVDYYADRLRGAPEIELPIARPRPAEPSGRGRHPCLELVASSVERLTALARNEDATLFAVLLTAFEALLLRYSGQTDLVVGTSVANRRSLAAERVIGMLVNNLAVRVDLAGEPSLRESLQRVQAELLGALEHQDVPFEQVVEAVRPARDAAKNPIFQIMFNVHGSPPPVIDVPGLDVTWQLPIPNGTSKMDINIVAVPTPDGGLRMIFEHDADLFAAEDIDALIAAYRVVLEQVPQSMDEPLSNLQLLGPADRASALAAAQGPTPEYPRDRSIVDLFAAVANASPTSAALEWDGGTMSYEALDRGSTAMPQAEVRPGDRVAVPPSPIPAALEGAGGAMSYEALERGSTVTAEAAVRSEDRVAVSSSPTAAAPEPGRGTMTYEALDRGSTAMAQRLVLSGVRPGDRVALLAVRGPEMIVSMLAILKAGAAYVPFDPEFPAPRLELMLRIVEPAALIADHDPPWAPGLIRLPFSAEPGTQVELPRVDPEASAYVLFTSGSTGTPRGVDVPHRAVVRLLFGVDYVRLDSEQRTLHHSVPSFDLSTFEVWGALLHGGCCVLAPPHALTPRQIVETVRRHRVSTLWLTGSLFNAVVDDVPDGLAEVPQILAGGEALSVPHVRRALDLWPRARLVNGYGPTESGVFACCHPIARPLGDVSSVPIGRPIANTSAYVLDPQRRLLPAGVPGELYLGGDGLARGYVGDSEATAERFTDNPFGPGRLYRTGDRVKARPDGVLEFLGRTDRQVKLRGFRIELDEVEQVILRAPGVHGGAAVVQNAAAGVTLRSPGAHAAVIQRDAEGDILRSPGAHGGAAVVQKDSAGDILRSPGAHGGAGVVQRDAVGEARLVAFFQPLPIGGASEADVDAFLKANLPKYMCPTQVVRVAALPKTPSGKLDRGALEARTLADPARPGRRRAIHATEMLLVGLWSRLLGVDEVGRHDNFFDLGGHSLLAARLVDEMEAALGVRLPLTAVFAEATVAGMARRLQEGRQDTPLVVPVRLTGELPPLFFLHGDFNGGGFYAARIAKSLGERQPFYLVHPFGVFGSEVPGSTAQMAERYVEAIRAERPHGPYRLAGFCTGGIIAQDVARRLAEAGEQVDRLVVIDARPLNAGVARVAAPLAQLGLPIERYARRPLLAKAWLQRQWTAAGQRSLEEQVRFVRERVPGRLRWTGGIPSGGSRSGGILSGGSPTAESADLRALALANLYHRRLATHVPRAFNGAMTAIWPNGDTGQQRGSWRRLARRVDDIATPGDHLTCLTDHWQALATRIAQALGLDASPPSEAAQESQR